MSAFRRVLLTVLLAHIVGQAGAQEAGRLSLQTLVEKATLVVDADGTQRNELSPVDTAVPGDEVIYTVVFTNVSEESADNVRVTNPIPAYLRYVEDSAFGPGTDISYSIDGGTSFATPQALFVPVADGEQRPASADDYTHIRWTLNSPLEAGARGFARFRAVVR